MNTPTPTPSPTSTPTPAPVPTPVPAPGPSPYASVSNIALPNVPANTYQLLCDLANAIDTANGQFNQHAASLTDIAGKTSGAINEVVSTSKGQATDALASTWHYTQTDFDSAKSRLTTITGSSYMGGTPNPLWTALDEHKSTIQTGLTAMENIHTLQVSCPVHPPTAQQIQTWVDEVNAMTDSLGNINLVLETIAMAIRDYNGGLTAVCATGFTPGMPIPAFTKNAFASQANATGSGGSGDGNITEEQLTNDIQDAGGSEEASQFIPILAEEHGLSLDNIKALLDTGVKPDQIYQWLLEDTQYKITNQSLSDLTDNVKLLTSRGTGDATQVADWVRGLDDNQLEVMKNRAAQSPKMSADDLKQLVDPQLEYDPNPKHDVKRPGVGPQPSDGQRALDNSVSYKPTTTSRVGIDPNTGEIVVLDDTNNGKYHGHVETWQQLDQDQQNALANNGFIDSRGRIIIRDSQGNIIGYGRNVKK